MVYESKCWASNHLARLAKTFKTEPSIASMTVYVSSRSGAVSQVKPDCSCPNLKAEQVALEASEGQKSQSPQDNILAAQESSAKTKHPYEVHLCSDRDEEWASGLNITSTATCLPPRPSRGSRVPLLPVPEGLQRCFPKSLLLPMLMWKFIRIQLAMCKLLWTSSAPLAMAERLAFTSPLASLAIIDCVTMSRSASSSHWP